MPQLHIDEVYSKKDSFIYAVNFQNGYPTNKFKDSTCLLFEENKKKTIAASVSNLLYTGSEIEEDIGKTLILARDKRTGKVRLFEVGTMSVKPSIKSNLENSQLLDTSNLELGRKFGSKKQKKYLEQMEKLKLNDQSVLEQMQSVSQNISLDVTNISVLNETITETDYLPPCNRDAKRVQDVYPIEDMLPTDLYSKIYNEIADVDLNPILLNTIKAGLVDDSSKQIRVLSLYCNTLFSIAIKTTSSMMSKAFDPCVHSATLSQHILDNFFGMCKGRKTRSLQMKDKALCHGLVYLLLITNFKFNFDNLCSELKLSFKALSTKLKMTGAITTTEKNKHMAVLKLPLAKIPLKRKK